MCNNSVFNCWDIAFFVLGVIASVAASLYVIKWFKPKIGIFTPKKSALQFDENGTRTEESVETVEVSVKNLSKKYAAINLRVEICVVKGSFTYHFDLDRQDFLMIQKKGSPNQADERTYVGYKVSEYTKRISGKQTSKDIMELLDNEGVYLRVRIHASHAFTGFGRIFEDKFCYKNKSQFYKLPDKGVC